MRCEVKLFGSCKIIGNDKATHVKLRKGELRGFNSCPLSFARPVKRNLGFDLLIFIVSVGKLFQRGKIHREANIPYIYNREVFCPEWEMAKNSSRDPFNFIQSKTPKLYRMDTGQREWLVINTCQQV